MTEQENAEKRTYHGPITPDDLTEALIAAFHQGNLRASKVGHGDNLVVQIASSAMPASGGRTALSINLTSVTDGVMVQIGEQEWLAIAASLGKTALSTLLNPINLIGRLDDIAQDIASLQLKEQILETIDRTANSLRASHLLSEKLRRLTCPYCLAANPVGEPSCIACGAPLRPSQPVACPRCGFIAEAGMSHCPECGATLPSRVGYS